MSELPVVLDLDDEFSYHLGKQESWTAIQAADPTIIEDERVKAMLDWQLDHFDRHAIPASAEYLASEFEFEPYEPAIEIDELLDRLQQRSVRNQLRASLRPVGEAFKGRDEDPRLTMLGHLTQVQAIHDSLVKSDPCVQPLSRIPDVPMEFLVDPYIPLGTFTLLQGPGGIGKSTFSIWQIAQLDCNVLFIGEEDPIGRIRHRVTEAGIDPDRVFYWNLDQSPLSFPSHERKLEMMVKTHQIKLTVLDTVTEFMDPRMKTSEADDVTAVVASLRRVAYRTDSAVLGIGHSNRSDSDDAHKRIGGSIAWYNRAKSVLMLGPDPVEDDLVMHLFHAKHNFSGEGKPLEFRKVVKEDISLEFLGESDLEFREVFNAKSRKPSKTERTEPFFAEWESNLPATLEDIREDFRDQFPDISDKTLERVRKAKGWETIAVDGVHYVGTAASFRNWTPPGSSEPLTPAQRMRRPIMTTTTSTTDKSLGKSLSVVPSKTPSRRRRRQDKPLGDVCLSDGAEGENPDFEPDFQAQMRLERRERLERLRQISPLDNAAPQGVPLGVGPSGVGFARP